MTTQPDEEDITVKPSGSNETVHDDIVSSAAAVDDNYPRPTNDDDDDDNDAERDECVEDDDAHPADGSTWDSVSLLEGKTSFHGKDAEEDIGGETLVSTDNLTEKPRAEAEEEAKSEILNQDEEQERPQQNHSVEKKNYLHDEEKSDLQPDDAHVLKETSNMSTPDEDPEAENGTHDGTQQQDNSNFQQYAMELNVALETLESMRKANLEVEFSTTSSALLSGNSPPIPFSAVASVSKVNHDKCTYCQRDTLNKYISNPDLLLAKIEKEKKRISGVNTSNNATVEGRNERGGIKFDGSRIRRFKNRFLSKSTTSNSSIAASSSASTLNSDADDAKNEAMKSCPPRLENSNDDSNTTNASDVETSERNTPGSISSAAIDKQSPQNINNPNEKSVLRRKPIPCLTCGHPTCSSHSSPTFSTKQIPICQPCAYLFELDFLVDVIATASASTDDGNNSNTHDQTLAIQTTCRQKVNDMIDCYDRAKLLLTYTAQYTDQIAQSLETRTARSNKIGAGSSATGLVSGITGVVGCSALLFPPVAAVGVPLLIASLVFGGTATAAQTGEAAVQYFSEPDRLADKMVALHGMALSLLRITEVLNYGLLKEDDGAGNGEEKMEENGSVVSDEPSSEREEMAKEIQALLEKHGINTSIAVKGTSDKGTTGASMTGRHSRYIGRVGTTAMSSARFIPVAGGVLSAACMVVEGRELKTTLSRISEGNLSAKADRIRTIREELPHLPDSSLIADECRRVFELAEKQRRKRSAAAAAATTSNGQHDEDSKTFPSNEQHDEEEEDENESLNATADSSTSRQSRSKSSGNNFDNMDFDGMEISDMIDEMQYAAMAESDREIAHVMNSLDHR